MDNFNENNVSLEKQIQLSLENEYLDFIKNKIKDETIECLKKRKIILEEIINYRKENIEHYRKDEDYIAEYFDHESYVKEQMYRLIDKRLKELMTLENNPYFGRVDLEIDEIENRFYIGRFGLIEQGESKPYIVDWRAPICETFYSGSTGIIPYKSPEGEVLVDVKRKRQYLIKDGILEGMFDCQLDIKDDVLKQVLSKNAGEKLKDIVMTIQKEQDEIIRQPKNNSIVVNGVAGSGKTTVALHRVAYLLYNYRNDLENKILILGPNNIFIDYISDILPSLGESGVKQTTFSDLVYGFANVENIMGFDDYIKNILENNEKFIEEVVYKKSKEYISKLDKLVDYIDTNYFKLKDLIFMGDIIVSKEEIQSMMQVDFKYMPLFKRIKKIKRILVSKIRETRNYKIYNIQSEYKDKVSNLSKDELELEKNNLDFMKKNEVEKVISESIKTKKKLVWLNTPDIFKIYNDFNENKELIFEDLVSIIYLKIKFEQIKLKQEIKHIVIDEAQDYSALQFKILKELTGCNSFTVVGDVNQRIVPSDEKAAMLDLNDILDKTNIKYYNLTKSYRSTKQIMEYANSFLDSNHIVPLVREGTQVIEHKSEDPKLIINLLKDLKRKGYKNIGVITGTLQSAKTIGNLIKKDIYIKLIDTEQIIYSGGEVIIPSYLVRGLEFDAAILVTNEDVLHKNIKYIMATRALHELIVINN